MFFVDELPRALQRGAATVCIRCDALHTMCACMRTNGRACYIYVRTVREHAMHAMWCARMPCHSGHNSTSGSEL